MVVYDILFRRFGIRLPQHLMAPVITTLDKFTFPRNSLHHSLTFDGVRVGPIPDEFVYRDITKQVMMTHILELSSSEGSPRKINQSLLPYISEYHRVNRRFRLVRDLSKISKDESFLSVVNYGFIPKTYRYIRNMYAEYYKWYNLEKTLWNTVSEISKTSSKNQFIFVKLPKLLPSVNTLNMYSKVFNTAMVKIFNTPESLFLLEIWKWLGEENHEDSVFSGLDQLALSKSNIVYQEGNCFVLLNLGVLNSWRIDKTRTDEGVVQKVRISPDQLQKRFLRLLMSLMTTRLIPLDPQGEDDFDVPAEIVLETPEAQTLDEETRLEKANRKLESLDSDLDELKIIENHVSVELQEIRAQSKTDTINFSDLQKEETSEGSILKICDKLATDGLLTAATYRNLINQSKSYKTIIAPDGQTTLEEYIKIDPEEILLKKSPELVDIPTVIDKSMLKSSLLEFHERYIEKILPKDVASMVVNIQKAGVILSNYNVEKQDDILGGYEIHTLRVRPVEGVSSTLRFKLPAVDSSGVVVYNNNRYKLRMQRGDVPIRKIAPDTVALTSYYGKTFVTRSPKRVNNYGAWLNGQIMLKGLDVSDKDITDLSTADMFDNQFSCPRVYSCLAMQFKSFTAMDYSFNFDHTKRLELFGQNNLDKHEKDSLIILAKNKNNDLLLIDKDDAVYEVKGNNTVLKGTIESILNINTTNAPVEFSEVKMFGKNISVGFILAYQMGLTNLLKFLKVEPRKVLAGQRLNLDNNEFSIAFGDCSLVFNREDKLASMIIAGLNEYSKSLRKYNLETMDKPNVYLNMLEAAGLGPRYLREIDLFTNLFVDPITRELLVEMKEPLTIRGLLVRSSELLLLDKHPDLLDLRYMRIKGYERMAGAVYNELVQSIRSHNSNSGRASKPLELHPYAVWKRVVQDPSMNLVSDINPIENIKEMEAVTYSGTGGRSARSMTKATREYHDTDVGVISEASKDSSHVGVNIYTSADPQFKSLRGTTRPYIPGKTGVTAMLSSSALLSPGSNHDD